MTKPSEQIYFRQRNRTFTRIWSGCINCWCRLDCECWRWVAALVICLLT